MLPGAARKLFRLVTISLSLNGSSRMDGLCPAWSWACVHGAYPSVRASRDRRIARDFPHLVGPAVDLALHGSPSLRTIRPFQENDSQENNSVVTFVC